MSWGEEQQKEIETIRERKITVKLSDADCDRLARKCGEHGLTIGELIENFVGDLVGGTYSNGSDERDYADQWFDWKPEKEPNMDEEIELIKKWVKEREDFINE